MKSVVTGLLIALLPYSPGLPGQQAKAQTGETRPQAKASQTSSADDIERRRQRILDDIRSNEGADLIAQRRMVLAEGGAPELVRRARKEGDDFIPDANLTWLAVMRRDAADGRLLELYERLGKDGKGTAKPQELLNAVAAAAMKDKPEATIGGEVVTVSPALSLDAGYTKASLDKVTLAALGVADTEDNARKIKGVADACLDAQNKQAPSPSTCYIAGLTFAAKDNSPKSAR